jgi:hypothetical protein
MASAADKRRWQQSLASPAPFTLDSIRATFGDFILNPRMNILRGLAEVFCDLDPAYKSHDKVKIGVKGLPKRIILHIGQGYGWGKDRLENVLNAIAAYQGKPLVAWTEIQDLLKNENALKASRGVHLKRYSNGNGHLHFEPETLRDINLALAEFYGDALADDSEEKPTEKAAGTFVAKDLQYYPTPIPVVQRIIDSLYGLKGQRILGSACTFHWLRLDGAFRCSCKPAMTGFWPRRRSGYVKARITFWKHNGHLFTCDLNERARRFGRSSDSHQIITLLKIGARTIRDRCARRAS